MLKRVWDGPTRFLIINITSRSQNVLVKLIQFLMYLLNGTVIFSSHEHDTLHYKYYKHSLNHFVMEMLKLPYGK
jgi:hypothetical protein